MFLYIKAVAARPQVPMFCRFLAADRLPFEEWKRSVVFGAYPLLGLNVMYMVHFSVCEGACVSLQTHLFLKVWGCEGVLVRCCPP